MEDYDNTHIKNLKQIINKFMEVCAVPENEREKVLKRLITLVNFSNLINLTNKLPVQERDILKELLTSVNLEIIQKFKSKFQPDEIVNSFRISAKTVLTDKINALKSTLAPEKISSLENLLVSIDTI